MKLRKAAVWMPTVSVVATAAPNGVKKEASGTMADELARINTDRKRRGAFMMDAFAHAAAVELGMLTREGRWYAESVAREAMWEGDESEWLAGAIVLRGFIRCRPLENPKRAEYERWLRAYEARWREFRDEHRQAMMAEVIMGAKQDILAL
ncbi:hypothetical protein GLOTRDRAFT_65003 [Gloeophyllum trabeum ATCC 11539]|uniref:Uncharacterized protein n=1 Tax=Gloeophyllum trabeum (strain ATCC 11539 / FP-39264 / Madison 617) TaxID=670483 RepID=S7PXY4_GLOTA|nr:uncharacterized protein GLOTRDRAFT_65003 [Gloeophyllum trabeum ATCC 11539]EPQ52207.1 hypothetical protein GLOTRDRAFT_65003 [Gloeophyllum trabeum ATCC 11539]